MKPTYVITTDNIIAVFDGQVYTTNRNNVAFDRIAEHIRSEEWLQARLLMDNGYAVFTKTNGRMVVVNDQLVDMESGYAYPQLTIGMLAQMSPEQCEQLTSALVSFRKNLAKNTLDHVRDQLIEYVLAHKLPITQDGHVIGFKSVKDSYMDIYSGSMDNSVGNVVSIPHAQCDHGNNTCSTGLHFGTPHFVTTHYKGDRIVVVQVNPQDVLCAEVNSEKARTCCYRVIDEIFDHDFTKYNSTTIAV